MEVAAAVSYHNFSDIFSVFFRLLQMTYFHFCEIWCELEKIRKWINCMLQNFVGLKIAKWA